MAYMKLVVTEEEKVIPVITRMQQIRQVLEEVEALKKEILLTEYNDRMPFVIKKNKVAEMRESLFLSEHLALKLMQQEIDDCHEDA